MKQGINKHLPIDLGHLREEPMGTVLDILIKEAQKHEWTPDEVAFLVRESTSSGTEEDFWKTIYLITDTREAEEDKRQVRYGISDIIVGPNDEPSKYAQVFDIHGKLLGEVEVYIIGYEDEEE